MGVGDLFRIGRALQETHQQQRRPELQVNRRKLKALLCWQLKEWPSSRYKTPSAVPCVKKKKYLWWVDDRQFISVKDYSDVVYPVKIAVRDITGVGPPDKGDCQRRHIPQLYQDTHVLRSIHQSHSTAVQIYVLMEFPYRQSLLPGTILYCMNYLAPVCPKLPLKHNLDL